MPKDAIIIFSRYVLEKDGFEKRQFLKDGVWTVDLSENCHILNKTLKFSYIALACLRNDILKLDYVYSSKNKFVNLICFFFSI